MRFCMEAGREIDPKFYLTVRNTEEAWHVECLDRIAEAFGGRIDGARRSCLREPHSTAISTAASMNAEQSLDSYVTCFAAFEDGLELELCPYLARPCDQPGARRPVLDRIIADKERHAAFGWLYLTSRAPHWSAQDRALIAKS